MSRHATRFLLPAALVALVYIRPPSVPQALPGYQVVKDLHTSGALLLARCPGDSSGRPLFRQGVRPSSGMGVQSLNVFIPEMNLWIQLLGPEQNAAQVQTDVF